MKKYIALLILLATLTTTLLEVGVVAFAENVSIENSYILDDLDGAIIGGKAFSPDDYDYSDEKEPSILSFAEYGYSYDKSTPGDYTIYLYVYNPTGREIRDTELNKVSIATYYENGVAVDYEPFDLELINYSTDKYAYLFYKFKVLDTNKIWTRVSDSTNKRRYDVGEIELNYGAPNSEAYKVGNYYEYSGFAKGYGANYNSESTLSCISDTIQTVQLDVRHANYVFNNVSTEKTTLHNVYFGVPSDLFTDNGTLQQIKINYYLTYTATQYYVFNKSYYDFLKDYIAFTGSRIPTDTFKDSEGQHPNSIAGWSGSQSLTGLPGADGQWTPLPWWYDYGTGSYDTLGNLSSDNLRWLFFLDREDDYMISSSAIQEYAQWYTEKYSKILAGAPNNADELLLDKYLSHLFVDLSKVTSDPTWGKYTMHFGWQGEDGKGTVVDANSKFKVESTTFVYERSTIWDWIFRRSPGDKLSSTLTDYIDPIYIVKDSDLSGKDEEVSKRLYVGENEVATLRQNYEANKLQGKKTVLLRYLTTPYLTGDMNAQMNSLVSKWIGYTVQQAVALNFDVIWLKFVTAEGKETVIPVVSNPTDGFTGFNPWEPIPGEEGGIDWFTVFLAIMLLLLIIFAVVKLGQTLLPKKAKLTANNTRRSTSKPKTKRKRKK